MSDGAKLRLPGISQEEDAFGVDLAAPSKFGIFLPSNKPGSAHQALLEPRRTSQASDGDSGYDWHEDLSDDTAPGGNITMHDNPPSPTESMELAKPAPRFSRAMSMPLPGRLNHLQNPRRQTPGTPLSPTVPPPVAPFPENTQFSEISLELADSVQTMVQTLLQISPSQVLDPAKEQYSACTLSVPTTSIGALFSSMKHLNYISANMSAFCGDVSSADLLSQRIPGVSVDTTDFDIGELLQTVGDALSGAAAHTGVDLVLFHVDVGMKHVGVKGDECGVSYALSNILRTVIGTARSGDSIDVELSVSEVPSSKEAPEVTDPSLSQPDEATRLQCTFNITHNFMPPTAFESTESNDTVDNSAPEVRPRLSFDTLILQRLLAHVGATLTPEASSKAHGYGRTCQLVVTLDHGHPSHIVSDIVTNEDPDHLLLSGGPIGEEPTVEELGRFIETLKGKKVTLYASSRSSFAHHLTSYLTAWGLDVSHVSEVVDTSVDPTLDPVMRIGRMRGTTFLGVPTPESDASGGPPPPTSGSSGGSEPELVQPVPVSSFIFIDDDVSVLRERLQKLRLAQGYPLTLAKKRPSLAVHHRPKSSPNVARSGPNSSPSPNSAVVILHFTSLANYKTVQDIVQTDISLHAGTSMTLPEVMIIPKPAGPRRFLTALHTAVTKPVVDPFFAPIATSPLSTGTSSLFNFNQRTRSSTPPSPVATTSGKPSNVRTNSDRSTTNRSPKETSYHELAHVMPPSPLSMSDSTEYFSEATAKLGPSPSSGLVIQSPDGQPAGIVFHPKGKSSSRGSTLTPKPERERPRQARTDRSWSTIARPPENERRSPQSMTFSSLHAHNTPGGLPPNRSDSLRQLPETGAPKTLSKDATGSPRSEDSHLHSGNRRASGGEPKPTPKVVTAAVPNDVTPTATSNKRNTRRPSDNSQSPQTGAKAVPDAIVVPPISVLIVDDNPINQTILSTFMKKKKIKYDVAKNGLEAVEKWKAGLFHLIFMDIQMPIMDGIEATKEIRRLERQVSGQFPLPSPHSEASNPLKTPSDSTSDAPTPHRSSVIIVALTASSLASDRVAALSAGCNDFLTKPVSLKWLTNKVVEWGSIKVLQMWGDHAVKSMVTGQAAQASMVAKRLHVPEGRKTLSRSPSVRGVPQEYDAPTRMERPKHTSNDSSDTQSSSDSDVILPRDAQPDDIPDASVIEQNNFVDPPLDNQDPPPLPVVPADLGAEVAPPGPPPDH